MRRRSISTTADAIEKLKAGDIDATIVVTGKPAPVLANLKDTTGLKLLAVPYAKTLEDEYYPATLTHDDYPALVPAGGRVDTLSVCAVLVSFNWPSDSVRYKKIAKFVDRFFSNFDALPGRAAPSEMGRGQFRGDARRLADVRRWRSAGSIAPRRRRPTAPRAAISTPFLPQASNARNTPISECGARRSVPGVPGVE